MTYDGKRAQPAFRTSVGPQEGHHRTTRSPLSHLPPARNRRRTACIHLQRPIKTPDLPRAHGWYQWEGPFDRVKFNLIDKIELLAENRIVAVKYVSLAEEYLADHFPTFPVLPGVMMLEAITQAAGWLLHQRRGFAKSMVVLKEARNVKYGYFVAPGNFLKVDVEWNKDTDGGAAFKATGTVGDKTSVQARVELAYFNLADKQPELAALDAKLLEHTRRRWDLIRPNGTDAVVQLAGTNA